MFQYTQSDISGLKEDLGKKIVDLDGMETDL